MTKEQLMELGLTEQQATKVAEGLAGAYVPKEDVATLQQTISTLQADNKSKDDHHAAEIKTLKLNNAVEKALSGAKAKNSIAAKALLAAFLDKAELAEDGSVKGLTDEIKKLTDNTETRFLFDVEAPSDPGIAGASPAGTVTTTPDPKRQGYETRLADARKTGDNLTAIQVKQEAAAEGLVLL